jgi:hypothetical protein
VRYELLLQVASISQLTVSRLSRQCGILNISQSYRPTRPVTGIALLYFLLYYMGLQSHRNTPLTLIFENHNVMSLLLRINCYSCVGQCADHSVISGHVASTRGGRSDGTVRSRTQATEFSSFSSEYSDYAASNATLQ